VQSIVTATCDARAGEEPAAAHSPEEPLHRERVWCGAASAAATLSLIAAKLVPLTHCRRSSDVLTDITIRSRYSRCQRRGTPCSWSEAKGSRRRRIRLGSRASWMTGCHTRAGQRPVGILARTSGQEPRYLIVGVHGAGPRPWISSVFHPGTEPKASGGRLPFSLAQRRRPIGDRLSSWEALRAACRAASGGVFGLRRDRGDRCQ
jgi:hypothetical protein